MEKLIDVCQLWDGAILYRKVDGVKIVGKCQVIQRESMAHLVDMDFKDGVTYRFDDLSFPAMRFYNVDDVGAISCERRWLELASVELFDYRLDFAQKKHKVMEFSGLKNQITKYANDSSNIREILKDQNFRKIAIRLCSSWKREIASITDAIELTVFMLRMRCLEIHEQIDKLLS